MKSQVKFIKENAFGNVVCKIMVILARPQYVKEMQEFWATGSLWLKSSCTIHTEFGWKTNLFLFINHRISNKKGFIIEMSILITVLHCTYRQSSIISCTLTDNKIVDHSDVVEASPGGAAPTTSPFSTEHMASMDSAKTTARQDEKHSNFGIWCNLY